MEHEHQVFIERTPADQDAPDGEIRGKVEFSGPLSTAGAPATATVLPAAGTGATVTVNGNDTNGEITLTAGSGNLNNGAVARLAFNRTRPNDTTDQNNPQSNYSVNLTPGSNYATRVRYGYSGKDKSGFNLFFADTPTAGKVYIFSYFVIESD